MLRTWGLVLFPFIISGLTPILTFAEGGDDPGANQPVPAPAGLFHPPVRLLAADGIIDSGAWLGHSSPWVFDVDGDGVRDLIVGDFSGLFRFYHNQGTNAKPRYAKAVNLKAGGVDATVPIY